MSWDGEIRRSQLLTSAGPGALIDLPKDAVIVGSLDNWFYEYKDDGFFQSPRLEKKVLYTLKGIGKWGHNHVRLRTPPNCEDDKPNPRRGIRVGQFPKWYLCQNPKCRSLVFISNLVDPRNPRKIIGHKCTRRSKPSPVVPIRFVSGCLRGHIQDIHWQHFVHRGKHEEGLSGRVYCRQKPGSQKPDDELGDEWESELYLMSVRNTGDLADLVIGCRKCGAVRGLQDLAHLQKHTNCRGWRPWLGNDEEYNEVCDEKVRLLIRTAPNSYFSHCLSALSLNEKKMELHDILSEALVWRNVENIQTEEELRLLIKLIPDVRNPLIAYSDKLDIVFREIQKKQNASTVENIPIREEEWDVLMGKVEDIPWDDISELPDLDKGFQPRRLDEELPDFLDRVVLIHGLEECRAQIGFSRFEFPTLSAEGELDTSNASAEMALLGSDKIDWVPAIKIRGEGVFLAFNESQIRDWESKPAVKRIAEQFAEGMAEYNKRVDGNRIFHGPRLIMLHSLAHMLISIISTECGYSAAAIKERIYCHRSTEPENSRAGILLYTGTPGSEGTLGGLIEVGRDIVQHLKKIDDYFSLCSNDPVCAKHKPNNKATERWQEGAVCHSCLLIAEPSCERMNRDLDRTLVIPTVVNKDAAFLGNWIVQNRQSQNSDEI